MSTSNDRSPRVLSVTELADYRERGFVRVKQAFPPEVAEALRHEVWAELGDEYGIVEDDPSTWRQPPRAPRRTKASATNERVSSPRLLGAIRDVLEDESWPRPDDWGGFLVTFPDGSPEPWDLPHSTWHWDAGPTVPGPIVFSFYSEVGPRGGGTLILAGSHRLLRDFYVSMTAAERSLRHKVHRRMFSSRHPWLARLTGQSRDALEDRVGTFMERTTVVEGVPCRVVELTGEPGDVVLCQPMILHSPAPNRSDRPRIMRVKIFYRS